MLLCKRKASCHCAGGKCHCAGGKCHVTVQEESVMSLCRRKASCHCAGGKRHVTVQEESVMSLYRRKASCHCTLGKSQLEHRQSGQLGCMRKVAVSVKRKNMHSSWIAQWYSATDSWSNDLGFESRQERWENILLQGQLSVLTLISVSLPLLCFRSST